MASVCISSWIVLDDAATATAFPSVGGNSAAAGFQMVYWRCIASYFFSSKVHNPDCNHVLFSNIDVESTAPAEIVELLRSIDVVFHEVPITYRLPTRSVTSWGNQFYVLDVVRRFAVGDLGDQLILADSDCIWRRSISPFVDRIVEKTALLYTLRPKDQKDYEVGRLINGVTHQRMTELAQSVLQSNAQDLVKYHGGEFLAVTLNYCRQVLPQVAALWDIVITEVSQEDSVKEEAQFLSIIAHVNQVEAFSANDIIRRIWTNFEDLNVETTDQDLVIWHLPAEKKFGFRRLFDHIIRSEMTIKTVTSFDMNRLTARFMGIPRRGVGKITQDLIDKALDRLTPTQLQKRK